MRLAGSAFKQLVRNGPLAALDLLLISEADEVLVGLRRHSPARAQYFVPGGRVYKNESLADALGRISRAEMGCELEAAQGRLHGIYEHFYEDNAFGDPGFGTHYIVIALAFPLASDWLPQPGPQHDHFVRMAIADLRQRAGVHPYTRAYFLERGGDRFLAGPGRDLGWGAEPAAAARRG